MRIVDVARIAHETNRAYCQTLGDTSQPPWDEAPDWQKRSAVCGVVSVMKNPAQTPEQQHGEWMRLKQEEGWTYGPEKNPEQKKHPCMLAYEMLPSEQKVKDALFGGVVRALLPLIRIADPYAPINLEWGE